jgi:urease accessory protein
VDDWLLWQLVDSAFPTGGYAQSGGLEAAWHHGEVRDAGQLASFIQAALQQIGHSSVPFVTAAYAAPEQLPELDEYCDAFTTNHVANRASRLQGRAFLCAAARIFAPGENSSQLNTAYPNGQPDAGHGEHGPAENRRTFPPMPVFGHFPPVFGATTQALGLSRSTVIRLFFFNHLRSLLAAAVRLNIVGPMEGQRLQHRLAPWVEEVLQDCAFLDLEDLCQTAPLLDLWQGTHGRLYARLFQS